MHRRLRSVLLAWLLIMVTSTATTAQTALDEDPAERTTEIPGSTFGVTLPVAWLIVPVTDDRARGVIFASDVQGKRACNFSRLTDVSSAEAKADETVHALRPRRSIKWGVHRTTHAVPAGTAVRVSYRPESFPDDARFVQHEYFLDAPGGVVRVHCWGDPPAPDRWLSVVEAIAPLPADGAAVVPFDPRVEVPEHGLALDLGAKWHVDSASGWWDVVLGGDVVFRALTFSGTDASGADCWLEDETDVPSLAAVSSPDDWRRTFIEAVEHEQEPFTPWSPGRPVSEPTVADAGLSSTNGLRLDWEAWGRGSATAWVLLEDDRRVVLFCQSREPPEDRWRSIAETFEFMPGEE